MGGSEDKRGKHKLKLLANKVSRGKDLPVAAAVQEGVWGKDVIALPLHCRQNNSSNNNNKKTNCHSKRAFSIFIAENKYRNWKTCMSETIKNKKKCKGNWESNPILQYNLS